MIETQVAYPGAVARGALTLDPATRATTADRRSTRRLLVAWFGFTLNGGIGMFLNVARHLERYGHQVAFLSLSGDREHDWPEFPGRILTLDEARQSRWDAVMVPGAGAPREKLEQLAVLREPCFGRRVQHILSDTSIVDGFNVVNAAFEPDLVIFNNSHWRPRDFRHLTAGAFHILPGAVDTDLFYPLPLKTAPLEPPAWHVGAYAGRCLEPVLGAAGALPSDCIVHLFGGIPPHLTRTVHALMRSGRVEVHGALTWAELAEFYRAMDVFMVVQDRAGWCCPAAEAMASGLPCVVGRQGTVDFARDGDNALVVDALDPNQMARAAHRLRDDATLRTGLARRAAETMRQWSWHDYCARLLDIVDSPAGGAYYRIPELGLHGTWEPEDRFAGLEGLAARATGASVLDLGAAEGVVGWLLARCGARLVHGIEIDAGRAEFANQLIAPQTRAPHECRVADLSDWRFVTTRHGDWLLDAYDIVLLLGVYRHLPAAARRDLLAGVLERCHQWLAIRTDEELLRTDGGLELIHAAGFELNESLAADAGEGRDWLGVFARHRRAPDACVSGEVRAIDEAGERKGETA
jgi:glycosyltransferase involved in cell wall biosynthesis